MSLLLSLAALLGLPQCPAFDLNTGRPPSPCLTQDARYIELPTVGFEVQKAVIKPANYPMLTALAHRLRALPITVEIELDGATFKVPRGARLTRKRAAAIRQFLVAAGVEGSRLTATGYGGDRLGGRHRIRMRILKLEQPTTRSAADCAASALCAATGLCGFERTPTGGRCIVSPTGCAAASTCRQSGQCTAKAGICQPTTPAHCRASAGCRTAGACSLVDGRCAAQTTEDCASTPACQTDGLCTPVSGVCAYGSDADCARSAGCRRVGQCRFDAGKCVTGTHRDCRRSAACRQSNQCASIRGQCRATDAICRASAACTVAGRCKATRDGMCWVGGSGDCKRSANCRRLGLCTYMFHNCGATASDCRASEICRRKGHCRVTSKNDCRR